MAKADKKMIAVNWPMIGRFFLRVLKFIKWPVTLLGITYLLVTSSHFWRENHINWELLLKYVDVVIWPLVVLVVLWRIRPYLPGLFARLEGFNFPGGNAKFGKAQEQVADSQADELKEIAPDASEPNTKPGAEYQITDDNTHALLTSYDAAVAYAQVYANIFGTQLDILRRLVDYTAGLKVEDLEDILKEHRRRSNGKGFESLIGLMQFLMHNTLVLYEDDTQKYKLTIAGFYFLAFLHKAELLERSKEW